MFRNSLGKGQMGRTAGTLSSVFTLIGERQIALVAAGVAFYGLLAIFPGVTAVVALWGLLSDPAMIDEQVGLMSEFVPDDAYDLLADQVDRMVYNHQGGLGFTTAASLLVALWSSRLGVGALIQGVNAAHGVPDRGGVWHNVMSLVLTVSLMGVALVALAAVVVLPVLLAFVPLGGMALFIVRVANWAIVLAVVMGAIALVYRYGLNRDHKEPWLTPGLWLAVGVWAAASLGFSFYLANFGNYSAVYGSLGAVIALLMWFFISAFSVLLGAALNAVLEGEEPESSKTDSDAPPKDDAAPL